MITEFSKFKDEDELAELDLTTLKTRRLIGSPLRAFQ